MALNTEFTQIARATRSSNSKRDRVYKRLNYLDSPQAARVQMEGRGEVLILSSNNYLGLCDEPAVVQAGIDGLKQLGAGTASVRFICGTFAIHRELEAALRRFVGREASLSFVSAWNANEGLTATIAQEGDFVVSDALNHASIIDSMRLAKAISKCTTAVYKHADMDDLAPSSPRRRASSGESSGPTASSRWKARSRSCPRSCRSRATRIRSSPSTTRTRPACSARPDAEPPSTSACSAKSTSSRRRSARRSAARRADSSPDRPR